MEPTLHMKQGLGLLERVLQFYPIMREGNAAEVVLTEQDWLVLMDFTENPETKEIIPATVKSMEVDRTSRTINIDTGDCKVAVKMGM
ncbi:MAG: hypothetical protein ABIR47_14145 [Candidatus Kapaibacterium sp.]